MWNPGLDSGTGSDCLLLFLNCELIVIQSMLKENSLANRVEFLKRKDHSQFIQCL